MLLCDICRKPNHDSAGCPLILGTKQVVTIFGACYPQLMFFECALSTTVASSMDNARSGVMKVTRGVLSKDQVIRRLQDLVSSTFQ